MTVERVAPGQPVIGRRTSMRRLATRIGDNRAVTLGLTVLLLILLLGLFMPLPYSPTTPNPALTSDPPSGSHWFGTDADGFDVFSRTIAAGARDLPLALAGTLASLLVGVPLGLVVSSRSRWSGWLMRGLDIFQAFPLVVLAVSIVTLAGNRIENVVLAIMVINVPRFMRLIRSEALALRETRFIEAAAASGATTPRILRKHVMPNVVGITLAQASLAAAQAMVVIAALSFLGVGVSPPNPSWGVMIQDGAQQLIVGDWWIVLFPGLAVLMTVACFNLVADGIQLSSEDAR